MRKWKLKLAAFAAGFGLGLALFLCASFVVGLFTRGRRAAATRVQPLAQKTCGESLGFASPEEVIAALRHEDVLVRRAAFERLFLRPGVVTAYYDYERDRDYPERAARAEVKYLNIDERAGDEALVTFVRYENPAALILRKDECGWGLAGALSSWLRSEDYPYQNWLETPERAEGGAHDILVRESTGDATRYTRNARLLRLTHSTLTEVASFTEESITPVEGYNGADWSDVKTRETTRHALLRQTDGRPERLMLWTRGEVIIYSGAPPSYTYWLETDGAWHTARMHWRGRASVRLRDVGQRTRELVWDDGRQRFVEER
ncbi:MAG TPA: hypothetical protein VN256_26305 [Pyrinomonadaceae bacterium]|nr:hypothetical protein [Pyrinomonadaceae bacterium]